MKKNNFRIWDKKNKQWLENDEENGLYYCLPLNQYFKDTIIEIRDYDQLDGTIDIMDEIDDVVIMQSSGIFDVNKAEVYEGDIITWTEYYPEDGCYEQCGTIIFEDASFLVEEKGYTEFELSQLINQEFSVIGNIHEMKDEVGGAENENN